MAALGAVAGYWHGAVWHIDALHQARFLGHAQQPAMVLLLVKIFKKLASIRRIDCLVCY